MISSGTQKWPGTFEQEQDEADNDKRLPKNIKSTWILGDDIGKGGITVISPTICFVTSCD